MYIIVQLYCSKIVEVKDNWVNLINNEKNCSESIVQSISFHNELSIRNPMNKNKSSGKCFLKRVESIMTGGVKLPGNILSDEVYQWNDNV